MSRITYLNPVTQLTAQDLTTVKLCDRWLKKLHVHIGNLEVKVQTSANDQRSLDALRWKRRAVTEVEKRRAHLVRLST